MRESFGKVICAKAKQKIDVRDCKQKVLMKDKFKWYRR